MNDLMFFEDEWYPEGYPDELIPEYCFTQDSGMRENCSDTVYYYQNKEGEK